MYHLYVLVIYNYNRFCQACQYTLFVWYYSFLFYGSRLDVITATGPYAPYRHAYFLGNCAILVHVSISIALVVNSQFYWSVYFCVYVYPQPPRGSCPPMPWKIVKPANQPKKQLIIKRLGVKSLFLLKPAINEQIKGKW